MTMKTILNVFSTSLPSHPNVVKSFSSARLKCRLTLLLVLALPFLGIGQTPDQQLLEAGRAGDLAAVQNLLANKVNVNAADPKGRTALMLAMIGNHADVAKLLLENGADPEVKDGEGKTAVELARELGETDLVKLIEQSRAATDPQIAFWDGVKKQDVEAVKHALEQGADVNAKSEGYRTGLIIVATHANLPMVQLLVEKGATVNAVDFQGRSALDQHPSSLLDASQSQSIYKQDINGGDQHPPSQSDASQDSVAGFLQKSGAVRLAGKLNRQFLDAVDKNDPDMAGALLAKGADPNHFGHTGGNVLMRASAQGNVEMIKLLLAKGSNPNMGTVSDVAPMVGRTALFFAAEKSQAQAAKLLIDQGAKVNTRTKGGTTALMVAAEQAKGASTVKVLLDAGADVNAKRSDGATALVAGANGSVESINYLLGAGADIRARLKEGDALTFAAGSGRADNLTALLKQPFSQSSKDDALLVAVQYAVASGRPEAVKVLLQNGADPNVKNANGVSAIQSAAGVGNEALVKLLKASGAKDNPQGYDSKTGAARPPADPATMTKAQWIELIAPFNASSRKFTSAFLSEAAFKKKFGAPVKTQRVGDSLFWYYQCSDGTLQVVVDADFLDQQGVVIKSVNEF